MSNIDKSIFNTEKTDYETPKIFFGQEMGLIDTVNKQYPAIFDLYKKMKALDWDETEFNFEDCMIDFKTCDKNTYDMMIRTLAWQWEADSVASRSIVPIVAPFCSSSEVWVTLLRISDNESIHALTYSEMVRNSFDNPKEVLADILAVKDSLERMDTVAEIFTEVRQASLELSMGIRKKDQDTYNKVFMLFCALLCLERIQFIASFAVTFAITNTGIFNQFGKAVQKICQDEIEVHAEFDKAVLDYEMRTDMGLMAFIQNRDKIAKLIGDVIQTEWNWIDYLFSGGRELTGVTANGLKQEVLWAAKPVYEFFKIQSPHEMPKKRPLGYMDDWTNVNSIQAAPQEERSGAYMLGQVTNDTSDLEAYDVEL